MEGNVVGEFPAINNPLRRTMRAPVNPLDKSTVVSIYPKHIIERKATIQPGVFELKPGSLKTPFLLIVESSSWWKEVNENEPLLEVTNSSIQVADSIVRDYCNGLFCCNMGSMMPGLFFVPGVFTVEKLKNEHSKLLFDAHEKQKRFFMELVKMADVMWARTQGNPLSISDDARMAAAELNIQNKPWLGDQKTVELVRCIACGNLRNPEYPICPVCKAIADPELAKKLNIQFAQ